MEGDLREYLVQELEHHENGCSKWATIWRIPDLLNAQNKFALCKARNFSSSFRLVKCNILLQHTPF